MYDLKREKKITAYIMAKNEAMNIGRCIDALQWCDEIVVADTGSTDSTVEIAQEKGCRVIKVPFSGFGQTRNNIIDKIDSEWIVCFDADEVCSSSLAEEIRIAVAEGSADAYQANRLTYLMGKPVRHSGWFPDYRHPVVFKKDHFRYTSREVHESFECQGTVEKLNSNFDHYSFPTLASMLKKEKDYAPLGAKALLSSGASLSMSKALEHGLWAFVRHFFIKKGFLDGWRGFIIAASSAHSTFFRYAIACEMDLQRTAELKKSENKK